MASTDLNLNMKNVMRDVKMNVTLTGTRGFAVRSWIAVKLITLAAWVLGCGVEVDLK